MNARVNPGFGKRVLAKQKALLFAYSSSKLVFKYCGNLKLAENANLKLPGSKGIGFSCISSFW